MIKTTPEQKEHFKAFAIITILAFLVLIYQFRSMDVFINEMNDVDTGRWLSTNDYLIKESITKYHQMPLWTSAKLTEPVILAEPQAGVFSLTTILSLILPSVYASMKLSFLIYYILAGLGMYFFLREIKWEKIALFGALAFMINGSITVLFMGYQFMGLAYASIPWILLFLTKGFNEKNFIKPAILSAIALALVFHSGGVEQVLFISPIFGLYFIFLLLNDPDNLKKSAMMIGIIGIIFVGLIAIKLLPGLELLGSSNRGESFDYQSFLGNHLTSGNFFSLLIKNETPFPMNYDLGGAIGFIGLLLVILSAAKIKQKKVIFFWAALFVSLVLMTENPITYFIWKFVPIFGQTRNLFKFIFIFNAAAAVLMAAGFGALTDFINSKILFFKKREILLPLLVIVVILVELGALNYWALTASGSGFSQYDKTNNFWKQVHVNVKKASSEMAVLQEMGKDKEIFRFKEATTIEPYGVGTTRFNLFFGLEDVYGINNLWNPSYVVMPGIAEQTNQQSKFYGMLNMKYLTAIEPINFQNFTLIKKFDMPNNPDPQVISQHKAVYGPYLYENLDFMPRAYTVNKAILVIGEKGEPGKLSTMEQAAYALMAHHDFDPKKSAVILSQPDIAKDKELLKKFDYVIMTTQIGQNEMANLQDFKNQGKKILPDILAGETQLSSQSVDNMFAEIKNSMDYIPAEYVKKSPNYNEISTKGTGFLVLSEVYSLYGGWTAKKDGKRLQILRANGAISAIPLANEGKIELSYSPGSYTKGAIITLLTILAIAGYFIYLRFGKHKYEKTNAPDNRHTD